MDESNIVSLTDRQVFRASLFFPGLPSLGFSAVLILIFVLHPPFVWYKVAGASLLFPAIIVPLYFVLNRGKMYFCRECNRFRHKDTLVGDMREYPKTLCKSCHQEI